MAIESLVREKYFLTSEQSECFASFSIEGAKYVVQFTLPNITSFSTLVMFLSF
jgi:hypothetical protein